MSIISKTTCLLCKDDASDYPFVTVGKKGLDNVIHYSQLRNSKDLEEELTKMATVTVHVVCRRDYTNPKRKVLKCVQRKALKRKDRVQ